MLKSISVGAELFHELIESDYYYVDKTSFIKTVFKDNGATVTLITRPRRFGKTLTMSTFNDFLSLDPENAGDVSRQEGWFKDTEIFKDQEFCSRYMGKFPVIFVSLKGVEADNFADAYEQFGSTVFNMYNSFSYLVDSPKLSPADIKTFKAVADDEDFICDIKNQNKIKNSLKNLTMFLYRHHGIKPIVLIDEYDVPIAKAASNKYYKEMIGVIRLFLGNALKTNFNLGRAVLTGCLRVAKESIFTGLNNPLICSVLNTDDDDISGGIGFTKEETEKVLSYYGLADYCDMVRQNYDGYYFGDMHMYCPWDVMSFCNSNSKKTGKKNKVIKADNYWINTSSNDVIEEFMGFLKPDDADKMQTLLDGGSIITPVREAMCYEDLKDHNITDFWTLLLYTGYLTFNPEKTIYPDDETEEADEIERDKNSEAGQNEEKPKNYETLYSLYIPNREIRNCFKTKIMDFFNSNQKMVGYTSDFVKGLFSGDGEKVENSLNGLLSKYVSIRDFSTKAPKENYYHGFINGLLVNGASLIKEQKSNFESGNGYVDLILLSADKKAVSILELKQTENELDDRITISEKAAEQIIKKKYADQFKENKMIQSVFAWGICFCKKECSVVCKKLK
jgi:hypothetical protein